MKEIIERQTHVVLSILLEVDRWCSMKDVVEVMIEEKIVRYALLS